MTLLKAIKHFSIQFNMQSICNKIQKLFFIEIKRRFLVICILSKAYRHVYFSFEIPGKFPSNDIWILNKCGYGNGQVVKTGNNCNDWSHLETYCETIAFIWSCAVGLVFSYLISVMRLIFMQTTRKWSYIEVLFCYIMMIQWRFCIM